MSLGCVSVRVPSAAWGRTAVWPRPQCADDSGEGKGSQQGGSREARVRGSVKDAKACGPSLAKREPAREEGRREPNTGSCACPCPNWGVSWGSCACPVLGRAITPPPLAEGRDRRHRVRVWVRKHVWSGWVGKENEEQTSNGAANRSRRSFVGRTRKGERKPSAEAQKLAKARGSNRRDASAREA